MFKTMIEWGLMFLIALTLVTQVIAPLFIPKLDLFWIFKSKKPEAGLPLGDVAHLKDDAIAQSQALKQTMNKVDDSINTLNDIKRNVQ